jgi:hypothetical protein
MHWVAIIDIYVSLYRHVTALPYPLPIIPPLDTQNDISHANIWSKEAILTLVGVCTAVACFIIGLAWPRLRRWLCRIPTRTSSAHADIAM